MDEAQAVKAKKVNGKWIVTCPDCGTEFEVNPPVGGYPIVDCPNCKTKLTPY